MGTNARRRRILKKQIIGIVALLIAGFFGIQYLQDYFDSRGAQSVTFELPNNQGAPKFSVRVAADESTRRLGLMYATKEDVAKHGMLFIFPEEKVQSFWMKDTPTSLDIIFVNEQKKVVGVIHETTPFSSDYIKVDRPSKYVVELLGGTAKKAGIVEGAGVRF